MSDEPTKRAPTASEAQENAAGAASGRSSRLRSFQIPALLRTEEPYWFALIVLGSLVRAWQILFFQGPMDHIFSDPARHLDNARHFLTPSPMGCSNPYFYQLFLWVVITLTKEKRIWMHLLATVLSLLYPYVWYRFSRTVMVRRVNALRLWAVLTVLPTHATTFTYLMNETVLLPLLGGALWATSVAAKRRSALHLVLAAVLWTCALLSRSIALPIGAVALGYALYRQPSLPLWRRPVLASVSVAIAAAGLWVAAQHSVRIFEYATPFGDNNTASLYMVSAAKTYETTYLKPKKYRYTYSFSSPSLYISPFYPFYEFPSVREGTFKYTANVELHGKDLKELWRKQLQLNWRKMPRLIFENIVVLTFGHSWPESGTDSLMGQICLQERWIWMPTILTSVIGSLVFMIRRRRLFMVPALVIFATGLLYGLQLVVMEGRYRKPIEPIFFLGIFWLLDAAAMGVARVRARRGKEPAA